MVVKYFETKTAHLGYFERTTFKQGVWATVVGPSATDLADVAEQFNLNPTQLAHVRDHEELPRLEFADDVTYLFIRHAYTSAHGERVTAPLLLVLKNDALIIIIPRALAQEFTPPRATKTLRGTSLQMVEHVLNQYGIFLEEITHRIKTLRQSLHTHEISNQDLVSFVTLEEELNDFVSSLEPLSAIFQRLMLAHHFPLTAHETETLSDLILKNQQLLSSSTTLLRGIESIRNAHGTIATNNLNRTMKTLTVAIVLITLPNVIFSMLGMNMSVPFSKESWSFPVTISLTFLLTFIVFIVARKKKIF